MAMQVEKTGFVRHISFEDVRDVFPEVLGWDGNTVAPDIFITALGFEDRAVEIPEEFAKRFKPASTPIGLLACYESNIQDNECNGDRIRSAFGAFCVERREFCADGPVDVDRAVRRAVGELARTRDKVRVVFDISGSSGTLILSVMAALTALAPSIVLEVIYAEPREYLPSRHEYECKPDEVVQGALADGNEQSHAEQGVSDVDTNELYPGHIVENRPDRVIAVPSFRTSRLVRCLAHIGDQTIAAPQESITWILGEPPSTALKWRLELQRMIVLRQLAQMVGKSDGEVTAPTLDASNYRTASTRDYREILRVLISEIDGAAGSNLWLVHMGSKLQAIGVALALHAREEVAVLRARPKQFNAKKYSVGAGTLWCLKFDDLAGLLKKLGQVGHLELHSDHESSREPPPEF
jgi:hypothetical protein